jgi:hypothetical protein
MAGDAGPELGYASPVPLAQAGDLFRDGELLVVRDGIILPPVCILCGRPSHKEPVLLRFSYDASFRLTRRSSLQLGLKGSMQAGLCKLHRGQWIVGRVAGIGGVASGIALIICGGTVAAISEASPVPWYTPLGIELMLTGFTLLIVALFYFALRTRTLSCRKIEAGYLFLDGAAARFLKTLPIMPEVKRVEDEM